MKLLLVHRYIRPDTPGYAHMLYIMGKKFADEGHDVTIFSAQPSYNNVYTGEKLPYRQQVDGMTIVRTPLFKESKKNPLMRAINVLIFGICLFYHAVFRFRAYDLMTVTTFPPVIMAWIARKIGCFRKTRYVYHCMDLYPEVAQSSNILKRNWLAKIAKWIDKRNCQVAKAVVVLSEDMKKTVLARGISEGNLHCINNFIIDTIDPSIELPEVFERQNDKLRILFAGNIGRFQNLEAFVEAAKILAAEDRIELHFVGAGAMVEPLKKLAGDLLGKTVFFHPYLPIAVAMRVITSFDLGIVSLSPGVIESAYPSKTMTYLECGCKLLTMVESDSELANLVLDNRVGVVCRDSSPEAVVQAVQAELDVSASGQLDRSEIQQIGRASFGQPVVLQRWVQLFSQIVQE